MPSLSNACTARRRSISHAWPILVCTVSFGCRPTPPGPLPSTDDSSSTGSCPTTSEPRCSDPRTTGATSPTTGATTTIGTDSGADTGTDTATFPPDDCTASADCAIGYCVADYLQDIRGEYRCRPACVPTMDDSLWCADDGSCCEPGAICTTRGVCL